MSCRARRGADPERQRPRPSRERRPSAWSAPRGRPSRRSQREDRRERLDPVTRRRTTPPSCESVNHRVPSPAPVSGASQTDKPARERTRRGQGDMTRDVVGYGAPASPTIFSPCARNGVSPAARFEQERLRLLEAGKDPAPIDPATNPTAPVWRSVSSRGCERIERQQTAPSTAANATHRPRALWFPRRFAQRRPLALGGKSACHLPEQRTDADYESRRSRRRMVELLFMFIHSPILSARIAEDGTRRCDPPFPFRLVEGGVGALTTPRTFSTPIAGPDRGFRDADRQPKRRPSDGSSPPPRDALRGFLAWAPFHVADTGSRKLLCPVTSARPLRGSSDDGRRATSRTSRRRPDSRRAHH